jgi:hypothetical protein
MRWGRRNKRPPAVALLIAAVMIGGRLLLHRFGVPRLDST